MADLGRIDAERCADLAPAQPNQFLGEIDRGLLLVARPPLGPLPQKYSSAQQLTDGRLSA
jgi:hypothetical protein